MAGRRQALRWFAVSHVKLSHPRVAHLILQCTTDRCSIYFLEALWPELSLWDILPLMLAVRGKSGSGKDAHAPVVMREGGDVIPIHDIHDVGRLGTHGNGLLKDLECRAAADDRTISFEATSIASSAILLRQQVRVR